MDKTENIRYYFDIGSSTIKLYEYETTLELIEEKSIIFKKDFSEEIGVSEENIMLFIDFIKEVKSKYNLSKDNTEIYATGIWRKIPEKQLLDIKEKFKNLNLEFNVISHDEENDYCLSYRAIFDYDLNIIDDVIS